MISWISFALALLKFVNAIMNYVGREQLIQSGKDAAIAEMAASIHKKTEAGKRIWEKVDALSDDEVDTSLRDLEPK